MGSNPEVARVDPGTGTIFVSELVGNGVANMSIVQGGVAVAHLQAGRGGLGLALDHHPRGLPDEPLRQHRLRPHRGTDRGHGPGGERTDGVDVDPASHTAYVSQFDDGTLSAVSSLSLTSTTVRCAPAAPRVGAPPDAPPRFTPQAQHRGRPGP